MKHWWLPEFSFGGYSPGILGDGSPTVGSRGEAPVEDLVPQKLKQYADTVYRF